MQGVMFILNDSGDTAMAWDTEVTEGPLDPAYVKQEFDRLVRGGHMAFGTRMSEAGLVNEHIRAFDATYPKITVSPQYAGG